MIEPVSDRRPPITPQLALRVAIFGAVAFGLFAIVFFRLWYLQVLSGESYLAQANSNRVRVLAIQAPRGKIIDRDNRQLVVNKRAAVIQVDPTKLPQSERTLAASWGQHEGIRDARPAHHMGPPIKIPPIPADLKARFARLGKVLNLAPNTIHRRVVRSLVLVPYSPATVKTDVPSSVLSYIRERPELFPGVKVDETFLRSYPQGTLAAQVLGGVGQITKDQLKQQRFRGVKLGTIVGQGGLEYTYDKYLRGQNGSRRVQVDADGRPIANGRLRDVKPVPGERLKLSLDADLERTAAASIAGPLNPGSNPGAFLAMDPRDGQLLAMGSFPTFDPSLFTKPISEAAYKALTRPGGPGALNNRAIVGAYPSASTFKPITALAGLDKNLISAGTTIDDTGCIQVGELKRCNAKHESYGTIDMAQALQVSSDVYFYKLGSDAYYHGGLVIQRWARKLGLGHTTGVDLPGEFGGLIPDPAWRARLKREELACRKRKHISPTALTGCGISDMRPYNLGDTVNLATGQGDVEATPLQMATVYAAIENGGKIVTPHLGLEIDSPNGELVQRIAGDPTRQVSIDPANLAVVRDGLRLAAETPEGTSGDVFAGWDQAKYPVYGKTGTAERPPRADQSWYVAYVPDPKRPIVVAVTVEQGGFGAAVAAPIACRILAKYYSQDASKCQAGTASAR